MTPGEFELLHDLDRFGPQTPGELAAYGLTRDVWGGYQTVTCVLTRLQHRGLVLRGEDGIWELAGVGRLVVSL